LLFLVLLCLAIGQLGVFFMTPAHVNWYISLQKPDWIPSHFIFLIGWSVFYVLTAVSVWLVWLRRETGCRAAFFCWVTQLFLNALWVPLFFGQQNVLTGLVMIGLLGLFTLITTVLFFRHSRFAAFLMLLYFFWILYAGMLNFAIWQLNR
jgi:benzodiazapine receptor